MSKKETTDIEKVSEVIELFLIYSFDTIEMAGSVTAKRKESINYFGIDLSSVKWDEDVDKLHRNLSKYLREWSQKNISNFSDYVSISRLTIEYKLPVKDGATRNQSRYLKLFYLPSYYFRTDGKNTNLRSKFVLKVLTYWHNILIRNTFITIFVTGSLISVTLFLINKNADIGNRLIKSFEYLNIASGIIASFILGFLINKVISIRQDKLRYTKSIKDLSNKLTYFRNICFNLRRDHNFWSREKPFYKSYEYANSIKDDISFEDYYYPDYDDDIKYANYRSFYKEDLSHSIISLILQLHFMADETFLDSGLSYTDFPPDYIYSHNEMKKFILFYESNLIWYCSSEIKIFPETFYLSYYTQKIVDDVIRIYPNKKIENLTSKKLEKVSLDFQYRIIPRLFKLTKRVDSELPLTIKYFVWTFILLLLFGIIIPTLTYIFLGNVYPFFSLFVVVGIILHILLTLNPILETENIIDKKYDYL